jgi:hypothetical protein
MRWSPSEQKVIFWSRFMVVRLVQKVAEGVPVALDRFKAPESFTIRGRKTGNERRSLTPVVDEMGCKPDRKASSETDEKTCPEHAILPFRPCVEYAALRWRYCDALRGIAQLWHRVVAVIALIVWGLLWAWHYIKRYRLAVGFMVLTLGFAIIRFISLHEVDAWNANAPWARTAVDLVAAAGVSAVAIARLWQLRVFALRRARIKAWTEVATSFGR